MGGRGATSKEDREYELDEIRRLVDDVELKSSRVLYVLRKEFGKAKACGGE